MFISVSSVAYKGFDVLGLFLKWGFVDPLQEEYEK
jgi:hypothetical protein